jgi:hypothetical protein
LYNDLDNFKLLERWINAEENNTAHGQMKLFEPEHDQRVEDYQAA